MDGDPKGYYAILGVQPGATEALIRAAYRVRAMEVHPDRNKSPGATEEFQQLQEAYACLSDADARRAYDSGVPSPRAASQGQSAPSQAAYEWNPVLCSVCGAISAQPRFRTYATVTSFLVTSNRTTHAGVFCAACETKTAARATGITLVMGWWGFYGFFWTLATIPSNLRSAWRHAAEDARLLCLQALYFASVGKIDLARAVAAESYELAVKKTQLTAEQKRKAALGYDVQDALKDVRDIMGDMLATQPPPGTRSLTLVRPAKIRERSFLVQLGMVGLLAALLAGFIVVDNERAAEARALRAQAEQTRLVREGVEREKARAIAEERAAALKALEQPLPPTGVMSRFVPNWRFNSPGGLPGLRVTAPAGASYAIKLTDWNTQQPVMTVFVRAGEVAEVPVPFGTYRITMANGHTWYGESVRFGPQTAYSKVAAPMEFKVQGDQLLGHELILTLVRDGNLKPVPIEPADF